MTIEFKEDFRNKRVYIKINDLENITRQSIRRGFFMLGKDLVRETSKQILKHPKTGRVYLLRTPSGRRRRHRSSAPGETHANLTGKLRRSLGFRIGGFRTLEFGYGVDKKAPEYGKFLEFGTARMAARPSLQNAMKAVNRNAETYVESEFEKLTQ